MIPAALVRCLWPHLFGGAPDREAPVGHQQQRGPQTPIAQVAQDLQPGLRRLAVAGPHGQYLFPAITHGADDDQQGRLVLLQPGLDVDAIRPRIHQFAVVETSLSPSLQLLLPLRPQPANGRSRQGSAVAQKPPQSQFEVTLRQPVQVELGQHPGHLVGRAHEQRQNTTLKALFQSPNARPSHLDGARHQRHLSRFAVSVAGAGGAVYGGPSLVARPPQKLRHLLLQNPLQQILDRGSGPVFQRGERGHGRGYRFQRRFSHGDSLLPCPEATGRFWLELYNGRLGSPFLFFHTY